MAAANPSAGAAANATNSTSDPKLDQLDVLLPGFSSPIVSMILKYLHIDVSYFLPFIGIISFLGFAWQYLGQYIWSQLEWFISTVEIRVDDEIYEVVKSWIASQPFAQHSHRFVVNSSGFNTRRFWDPLYWRHDEEEGESDDDSMRQTLHYTPAPGNHYFWYKRRLLVFRRNANKEKAGYTSTTEREEISISCLGRNPWVLKQLLHEAQAQYLRRDDDKTLIYRGAMRHTWGDPNWQRSLVRACRPFETVILSQKIKDEIVEDIEEYLNPTTRRWYANRGIPYRRGYLLYGPPGTGKSSLSLALAGHFNMRIYIVSLSSSVATEEHLSSLFGELPRRCIVLLEDIDTAGLTHTREGDKGDDGDNEPESETEGDSKRIRKDGGGKLSLSGLLNILDGVASQEGRILIMTTNHLEKLDKALIRPGRVDLTIKFSLADQEISTAIFRSIFAHVEGDDFPEDAVAFRKKGAPLTAEEEESLEDGKREREEERKRNLAEKQERVLRLASEFARRVPENEFSPAELQGFLLKHKRHPERAVECIEEWVEVTRKERQDREKAEVEAKRKAEERKALRKAKKKMKEKQLLKAAKERLEEDSDTSEDEAGSGSDDESSAKKKKKKAKKSKGKKKSEKQKAKKNAESETEAESDAEGEEEEQKVEIKVENADDGSKEEAKKTGGQGLEKSGKMLLDVEGDSKHGADSGYGTP